MKVLVFHHSMLDFQPQFIWQLRLQVSVSPQQGHVICGAPNRPRITLCMLACQIVLTVGLFYMSAISSLGVHGGITAGWSRNSKYAFLGSPQSAAQVISYEVSTGPV